LSTIVEEMTVPKIERSSTNKPFVEWEDFLDFSRFRIPSQLDVVLKRLLENFVRFSGNYCYIGSVLTLVWGVFFNGRILGAMLLVATFGFVGKLFFVHASMAEASLKRYKIDNMSIGCDVPKSAQVSSLAERSFDLLPR
jgi:hypothetical protein